MKYIFYILLFFTCHQVVAQQQTMYSNFLLNDYYFNPAIAGSKEISIASFTYRNQWVGFEGAPKTIMGNVSGSIKSEGKMGYGLGVVSESIGLTNNLSILTTYAQHFKINKKLKFGLGIQGGYIQNRVRLYDTKLADVDDDVFRGNVLTENGIDFNTGFNLYSDKYYFMVSIHHLFIDKLTITNYNQRLRKNYNVIGGYIFKSKNNKLDVEPSLMIQYQESAPVYFTGFLKATIKNSYWTGVSYSNNKQVGISLGYKLKDKLNFGYTYDLSLSSLQTYQTGSHEISISYILNKKKPTFDEEDEKLNNSILDEMKQKMKEKND